MWQRLSNPDVTEEAGFQPAPSSSEACSDIADPHQRFADRHSTPIGAGAAPIVGNDVRCEPRIQNGSDTEQALESDLGPLLGRLAASQARSSEAADAAPAVGAPRLAPDSIQEEDPVLKELDKLIARLDADEAAARAASRSVPRRLFR